MILAIIWLSLAVASVSGEAALRVFYGEDDHRNAFFFAVVIHMASAPDKRMCTGSLVAAQWVLTAAHCLVPDPMVVRYGDYTLPSNETKLFSKVIRTFRHPYVDSPLSFDNNDIALFLIEKVPKRLGILSALDYKTLIGLPVEYSGFGRHSRTPSGRPDPDIELNMRKPLQVGEAVVIPCIKRKYILGLIVCLRPKCSNRKQILGAGDSGGPLMHDGRIIGVCKANYYDENILYTAVSPYLQWIKKTMKTHS